MEDAGGLERHLKTYKDFTNPDGNGKANRILQGIHEVRDRVYTASHNATTDPSILRLVNSLCNDSVHFIQKFIDFVDRFYMDMSESTSMAKKDIWSMILACIEQIFDDLRKARAPYQDAAETKQHMYLWGTLHCHKTMKRYVDNKFCDDPAITGVVVRRMIRRNAGLTGGDKKAADTAKAALDKIKAIEKRIAALERNSGNS